MPTKYGLCRHCGRRVHLRPRRLCSPCFEDLAIREKYPTSDAPGARRGVATTNNPELPKEGTKYSPGTRQKLEELARRAEAKQALHHPRDCRDMECASAADLLMADTFPQPPGVMPKTVRVREDPAKVRARYQRMKAKKKRLAKLAKKRLAAA